jgi:hypothetical protein
LCRLLMPVPCQVVFNTGNKNRILLEYRKLFLLKFYF